MTANENPRVHPLWIYTLLWAFLLLIFVGGGRSLGRQLIRLKQDRIHLAALQALHMEKRAMLQPLVELDAGGWVKAPPLDEVLTHVGMGVEVLEARNLSDGWQEQHVRVEFSACSWPDVLKILNQSADQRPSWALKSIQLRSGESGLAGQVVLSSLEKPEADSPRF